MWVTMSDNAMGAAKGFLAMLKTLNRWLLIFLACAAAAACGQKGPLYLPGDPSSIYSAPPPQTSQAAEDVDEDDDDDPPGTIQN